MQWGHIKTLFILSFLILNIYLVLTFVDKRQDVSYLDNQELPIEEQLASENITYDSSDIDVSEATYISVTQMTLSEDDLAKLDDFDEQTSEVLNNSQIIAELESPIEISENMSPAEMELLVQEHVLYGEEYEFWGWNQELNLLLFFQTKEDRSIYYNENGLLLVYLNEDNEATHYTQTILGEAEVQGDLVALNQPIQVIGILYSGNHLNRGDQVTIEDMGYYSRISEEGIQVFAPTWNVTVNDERHYFVNGIEGIIYDSDTYEFLIDVINNNVTEVMKLDEDNDLRESVLPELNKRLELDNRSEVE